MQVSDMSDGWHRSERDDDVRAAYRWARAAVPPASRTRLPLARWHLLTHMLLIVISISDSITRIENSERARIGPRTLVLREERDVVRAGSMQVGHIDQRLQVLLESHTALLDELGLHDADREPGLLGRERRPRM